MIAQSVGLLYNTSMGKYWDMSETGKAKISAYAKERYKNNRIYTTCNRCGKEYTVGLSRWNDGRGRYCSKDCQYIDKKGTRYSPATEFRKGQIAWNKGLEWHNANYKGDQVSLRNLHTWVERRLGKPSKCDHCGTTTAKRFEWSNISREYKRELTDWQRLCTKCHQKYDGHSIVENNRKRI